MAEHKISDTVNQKWYVVVDNLIGGFAIANVDKTTAELDYRKGEFLLGSLISQAISEHVVKLHNEQLKDMNV